MILAVSKRWHLWRHRFSKWALRKVVAPLSARLEGWSSNSAVQANEQHDKARLRMEVCKRCPMFTQAGTCSACGCFMPAKTQITAAKCPQGRW